MAIVEKMKSIKQDVRELLLAKKEYRDSDSRLITAFYYRKFGGKKYFANKTALEFLYQIASGKFPLPDTITRVRRKLQQDDASLRGNTYEARHQYKRNVRKQIKDL
jgi:hypothetical protein